MLGSHKTDPSFPQNKLARTTNLIKPSTRQENQVELRFGATRINPSRVKNELEPGRARGHPVRRSPAHGRPIIRLVLKTRLSLSSWYFLVPALSLFSAFLVLDFASVGVVLRVFGSTFASVAGV